MELDEWVAAAPAAMRDSPVWKVRAYQIGAFTASRAAVDARALERRPSFAYVAPQLVRAAGSIAANIAEGYSRQSHRDRIRYYEYALGSAREVASWYTLIAPLMGPRAIEERLTCLARISQLLLKTIHNERTGLARNSPRRIP